MMWLNRFIGFFLLGTTLGVQAETAMPETVAVDGYAASVNGEIIMFSEVLAMVAPHRQRLMQLPGSTEEKEAQLQTLFDQALNFLIEKELALQEFKSRNIPIPDRLIDDQIFEKIQNEFDGNRPAFLDALRKEGMTFSEFRGRLKEDLLFQEIRREEVFKNVSVAPGAVRALYRERQDEFEQGEQIRLRMLGMNVPQDQGLRQETMEKMYRIRTQVLAGESFAALAKKHSVATHAKDGGDMGWIERSDLPGELRNSIQGLGKGELSDVVEVAGRFYVLWVEDLKPPGKTPFEEVEATLRKELEDQEADRIFTRWMNHLREKFPVLIFTS